MTVTDHRQATALERMHAMAREHKRTHGHLPAVPGDVGGVLEDLQAFAPYRAEINRKHG